VTIYLAADHGHAVWRGTADSVVAHLTIRNGGSAPAHLIEVFSPDYAEVRLRRTVAGLDAAGQRQVVARDLVSLVVPPHGGVVLGPKASYILASRPRRELRIEDQVTFALKFATETTLIARLPFVRGDPDPAT
jgi:copper(I)-binding protein